MRTHTKQGNVLTKQTFLMSLHVWIWLLLSNFQCFCQDWNRIRIMFFLHQVLIWVSTGGQNVLKYASIGTIFNLYRKCRIYLYSCWGFSLNSVLSGLSWWLWRVLNSGVCPMQWMGLMMIHCGMTLKRTGMLAVSVRKMTALTGNGQSTHSADSVTVITNGW